MNKTLTINLNGLVFHIDEVAYKKLEEYLSKIKLYLKDEEGKAEIISDIEARIAELFRSWKAEAQVIEMAEIDKIQQTLGQPEDYLDNSAKDPSTEENQEEEKKTTHERVSKKLFRDKSNSVLGGVCLGLAHYFEADVTLLRIIAVLLAIFSFSFVALLYIILWIIIPEAKTVADYLQMKGKVVNLENIKKNIDKLGKNIHNSIKNSAERRNNLGDFIVRTIRVLGKIALVFIGIIVLIVAFSLLIVFLILAFSILFKWFKQMQFSMYFVSYAWMYYLWIFAVTMIALSFLTLLIKAGLSCINPRLWSRKITVGLLVGLFVGLFTVITLTIVHSGETSYTYKYEKRYSPKVNKSTTLLLTATSSEENPENSFDFNLYDDFPPFYTNLTKNYFLDTSNNLIYTFNRIKLTVKESTNGQVRLVSAFYGKGRSKTDAIKNTKAISYNTKVDSTQIQLANYLVIPKNKKWRKQSVKSTLYLPVGQKISIGDGFKLSGNLINYDYDEDTYDNRIWQMTKSGFVCLNCQTDDNDDFGVYKTDKSVIRIDMNGIHISDKDQTVDIDSAGIRINK